jgi:hypothetical protein
VTGGRPPATLFSGGAARRACNDVLCIGFVGSGVLLLSSSSIANFRGKEIIGYRGGDLIPDPKNPLRGIDDPDHDEYDPVWNRGYHVVTLTMGYRRQLTNGRSLDIHFKVGNLIDEDCEVDPKNWTEGIVKNRTQKKERSVCPRNDVSTVPS